MTELAAISDRFSGNTCRATVAPAPIPLKPMPTASSCSHASPPKGSAFGLARSRSNNWTPA